jgi:hypothetical protein
MGMEVVLEDQGFEQEVALEHQHVEEHVDFVVAALQVAYAPPDPQVPHKWE